ncbi:HNH endonuclease family protein [Arthrobacter sp. R4-81]
MPEANNTYDRAYFEHWIDADSNGCDTRQEVLIAESQVPVTKGTGCTVTAGQWYSWYDGATWTNPSDVDIDHLVPLQEAWQSSAWAWTAEKRKAYANDLGYLHSLEGVTDSVNQSKGAQDPATWMPAMEQCRYAIDWITVKWRWNLTADNEEFTALNALLNNTSCGATIIEMPEKADLSGSLWPLYKIVYDATIYEMVSDGKGNVTPVPLSYAKWTDAYKQRQPLPASTDFVKYPWSPTVYAVTFWPGGEAAWMWTPLSYKQWLTAGTPTPRIAGWIKGSYYYQWGTTMSEIFVEGADGVNHKLTYKEWAASGFRGFERRSSEGFLKLSWANELARMTDLYSGAGRPLGYSEWQGEAFPTPQVEQRIPGDSFYQDYGNPTVWYAGPGMNRPITFREWQAAGAPAPTVRNAPPPGGGTTPPPGNTVPPNPGDTKNCSSSFSTWSEAQNWFDTYYPHYGDVANLDSDGDLIACETLPGAP